MSDNIFDDPELLVTYYQTQAAEFQWRFQAIWEAIKHYTWLLSILLAGWPIVVFASNNLSTMRGFLRYLIVAPALGLVFSIIAFFVIRRAYNFYSEIEARLLYIERILGLTSRKEFLGYRHEEAMGKDFSVKQYLKKTRPFETFIPWKARIRTLFLFGFIVFALVAILEIVFCLVY